MSVPRTSHKRRRSRRPFAQALLLVACGLPVSELYGQASAPSPPLGEVIAQLDSGAVIRVGAGLERTDGIFQAVVGTELALATETTQVEFSIARIDSLWVRDSGKRKGGLIGRGAGLALTTLFCAQTLAECGLDVGLLVITPTFALFGAGIGSLFLGWRPIFP